MNFKENIDEYSKLISQSNSFIDAKSIVMNMKSKGVSPSKFIYMVLLTKTSTSEEEKEVYTLMEKSGYSTKSSRKRNLNITTIKKLSKPVPHLPYTNQPADRPKNTKEEELVKPKRNYTHRNSKMITYNLNDIKIQTNNIETNNSVSNKTTSIELQTNRYNETTKIIIPHISVDKKIESIDIKAIGNESPNKKDRTITLTNRNMSLVRIMKDLYENSCQICNEKIQLPNNQFVIEVHHIKPLGLHNGADTSENMIVLCPNHHVMFDRGAISIDIVNKTVIHFDESNAIHGILLSFKHEINQEFIDYHNEYIFAKEQRRYPIFNDINKDLEEEFQSITYGDSVQLQDISSNEVFSLTLENKYNQEFLKPLEKTLIGKKVNDIIKYDCYNYKIINIDVKGKLKG